VGYTPDLTAAAWMGYDDFSSLGRKDLTGGSTVVPWWTDIMGEILKGFPRRDFGVPSGIVFRKIDSMSGMLALPTCPAKQVILEAFQRGTEPTLFCPIDHSKPLAPQLEKEEEQEESVAAPVAASPPGISTAAASGQPPQPPPLPSEDELDFQKQAPDEPVLLE
jgi:penicillin-binding protein 1A